MDNGNLENLTSMFPQIDKDIIVAILDQNHGDVNATIPQLLEISDPTTQKIPEPQPEQPQVNNNDQIKMDEEIARKLAQDLNDEEFARQLQEEEARNRQLEIQQEQAQRDDSVPIKEKISAGFESIKQKSRELYEKMKNKGTDQRNMNRAQYSNLPDNNEDSVLLNNNYVNQEQYNSSANEPSRNNYYVNGEPDEEETLDRRNPNYPNNSRN